GGAAVEKIWISDLMKNGLFLKGTLITPRSDDYKAKLTQEFSKRIIPLFEEDMIQPIIHSVLSFEDLPEAHRQMEASEHKVKIIKSVLSNEDITKANRQKKTSENKEKIIIQIADD